MEWLTAKVSPGELADLAYIAGWIDRYVEEDAESGLVDALDSLQTLVARLQGKLQPSGS